MTDPIRVLHFADIHIGMENYGKTDPETGLSTRVRDFLRRMDEMIEYASENQVDLTVFAGDAFKTRAPNPTFLREFSHRVRDLTALAPLVMLVGNHDVPPAALKASSIEIYQVLDVPNVWVASGYETRTIETRRGAVTVASAPYPMRSLLLEHVETGSMTIREIDLILAKELGHQIESMAETADALPYPRLLTGHFTVQGAVVGSERQIMLGRDIEVPPSVLADPRWDYVALGHVHKHQNLTRGREDVPPVVYAGSMERIDFGEEGDPKGYCWVELARGATKWHFQRVAARPFVTLKADLRQSEDPTYEAVRLIESHDLTGAVVRLIIQLTVETEARLNEALLRDALRRCGVSVIAAIRKEVEQPERARLGGNPEGMTDSQLLERYLMSRDVPVERRAHLIEVAEALFESARQHEGETA